MRSIYLALCFIFVCSVAMAKTESGSMDAQSVVAYGQYGTAIVPLKVDSSGAVYTSGGTGGISTTVTGDFTVTGTANLGAVAVGGADEKIYGATYPNNNIDLNLYAIGVSIDPNIYTSGNIGIGVPGSNRLTIQSAGASTSPIKILNSGGGNLVDINDGGANAAGIRLYNNTTSVMYLNTAGDSYLQRTTGNVGIGTVTPIALVTVGSGGVATGLMSTAGSQHVVGNFEVDGKIYNPGITVTSGNYVCFDTTSKVFYVKSTCP